MTCVITGCTAINGHQQVGGDLHKVGDCYVFNAIVNKNGETAWGKTHYTKLIDFSRARNLFERRGVFVAHKDEVGFNLEALEYMEKK